MLSIEKQILYLISSTSGIDVKLLIEIYEERGVSPQIIRNAISHLKKGVYIDLAKRSCYTITPLGKELIESTNRKAQLLEKSWDRSWFIVIFEIPETKRKKRDSFRNDLIRLGFGLLYKSIYVSPWNHMDEVIRLSSYYGLNNYIKIVNGEFVFNEITPQRAEQLWEISSLNEVYIKKQNWFHSQFQPNLVHLLKKDPNNELSIFINFLELGEVIAELSLQDPMLPKELLSNEWKGHICFQEFHQCLNMIAGSISISSKYFVFVKQYLNLEK